jgi:hypothetical protein
MHGVDAERLDDGQDQRNDDQHNVSNYEKRNQAEIALEYRAEYRLEFSEVEDAPVQNANGDDIDDYYRKSPGWR